MQEICNAYMCDTEKNKQYNIYSYNITIYYDISLSIVISGLITVIELFLINEGVLKGRN